MIMGLDVSIIRRKDLVCPKCGEVVSTISMDDVDSGGRVWYPFLESIGYYVPYDQWTEENDWYGKDMKTYKGMARNQMIEKIATAKVAECKARNDYTMSLLKQRMREQFPLLNQLGIY